MASKRHICRLYFHSLLSLLSECLRGQSKTGCRQLNLATKFHLPSPLFRPFNFFVKRIESLVQRRERKMLFLLVSSSRDTFSDFLLFLSHEVSLSLPLDWSFLTDESFMRARDRYNHMMIMILVSIKFGTEVEGWSYQEKSRKGRVKRVKRAWKVKEGGKVNDTLQLQLTFSLSIPRHSSHRTSDLKWHTEK